MENNKTIQGIKVKGIKGRTAMMTQNKKLQPVTGRHQEQGRRARHKLKGQDCEKKQVTRHFVH
jgi:hypothetical protein